MAQSPQSSEDSFPIFPVPSVQPQLLAIVYVHFDDVAGPQIVFQTPYDVLNAETFDCVKHYMIAYNDGFEDELVKICLDQFNIIGYTVRLYDEVKYGPIKNKLDVSSSQQKYRRNVFLFNMCFVTGSTTPTSESLMRGERQVAAAVGVDGGVTGDCFYEPLVKKLAQYLKELEIEESVLSNVVETSNRDKLHKAMTAVHSELRSSGCCRVQITARTGIFLKITALPSEPTEVKSSDVPMLKRPIPYLPGQITFVDASPTHYLPPHPLVQSTAPTFFLNAPDGSLLIPQPSDHAEASPLQSHAQSSVPSKDSQSHSHLPPPSSQKPGHHFRYRSASPGPNRFSGLADDQDGPFPLFLDDQIPFDVTTRQLLPYFNGLYHVGKIAELSAVDVTLVHGVVKNLVFYGLVTLVPIFQYCNRYALTGKIQRLYENRSLLRQCQAFVVLQQSAERATNKRPTGRDILALYCAIQPGLCVKDWMNRMNPRQRHVDERRLIQFGVWQGILRKITGYPVLGNRSQTHLDPTSLPEAERSGQFMGSVTGASRTKTSVGSESGVGVGEGREVIQWALAPDGTHTVEEFAIAHSLTVGDFVKKFEVQGGYIIWK